MNHKEKQMIEYTVRVDDGNQEWFFDNKRHRVGGPAVEWLDGSKHWYVNGKRHRTDGPAIELADGRKYWYVDGIELSEAEFNRLGEVKELSVGEIEALLGYSIKVVKE